MHPYLPAVATQPTGSPYRLTARPRVRIRPEADGVAHESPQFVLGTTCDEKPRMERPAGRVYDQGERISCCKVDVNGGLLLNRQAVELDDQEAARPRICETARRYAPLLVDTRARRHRRGHDQLGG